MEIAMSEDSLTVHILRDLRDELRSTRDELRQRIDSTNQRVDSTNQRIDHLEQGLRTEIAAVRDHIVESELRMATRFVEQTAATRDLYDLLNASLQLRDRVEHCEHDIADLKDRVV
jgi:chromosome segregation ATPase